MKEADLPGGGGLEGGAGADRALPPPSPGRMGLGAIGMDAEVKGSIAGGGGLQGAERPPGRAPPTEWAQSPVIAARGR